MNTDAVSQAIVKLLNTEVFYAEIISQMNRVITKRIPLAGVCIKTSIELHINLEEFEKLTLDERVAVLKHECEHLLRDHIPRSKQLAPEVYQKTQDEVQGFINDQKHMNINIAADLAINDHVHNLPANAIFSKDFDLTPYNTMEWYLDNLKGNPKAKNFTHFDDHSLWAESEGDKDLLKEKIKDAINKAATKARACGKMSAENELLVSTLNYKPRDWKTELRRFVAHSTQHWIETSRKKRNRRYGIQFPGIIKLERLHLGIAIDTSGSISDEALHQFMAEVGNIAKYADVTVVEVDSEIKNSYKYNPKKQYTIKGRGGTCYQPAFDYFNKEHDIDGLIYFGDMDCYDNEEIKRPSYPVLWAVVGEQKPPVKWGSKTKISIKKDE